jgi:signal transduction histidine kinase/CheY-like chemotaxis protein
VGPPIDAWRRRILAATLLGVCVLGFFAYVVGVSAAIINGVTSVIVVDSVVYGAIILLTLGNRLPYTLRASSLVVFPLLLGTFFLFNFGFTAAGFPWLLSFPIFASLLLGVHAGVWSVGILSVLLIALGVSIPSNVMPWTASMPNAFLMWWVSSSTVVLLGALVAIAAGYLFDGLGREADARQAAELEADRRERLASLGTLTGGIAHDFNNLLQPILSDAEDARRLLPNDHPAQAHLDNILLSTGRARTLVRRILSFARPAQGNREIVDLSALAIETDRLIRAVLPPSVELRTTVQDAVHVRAEPGELQQVLLNVVTNASQAMPDGGLITVSVSEHALRDVGNDAALAGADRVAVLTVTDTGVGMNSETLAHIFEPFFTTKRPGQGTGLGLATVHATITAIGGVVRAKSSPGTGTQITALLPTVPGPATGMSPVPQIASAMLAAPAAHVPVVDDEPAVLLTTARLLERLGYQVTRFSSPTDLLRQFDSLSPSPAALFTDLSMPAMSGWELASAVHLRAPQLPIVLMTGNLELEDDETAQHAMITGILSKPFTSGELQGMLQRCLGVR